MTLDNIADEIASGNTVELRNFGVFKTVMCKARIGRNPNRPAKDIIIPAHLVVKFLTGKELRTRIESLNPESLK
jgi:nucleoid DNA-binding protein